MNTFFRICIYFCLGILVFTLSINFVNGLGAFEVEYEGGITGMNQSNVLSKITNLDDPNMQGLFLFAIGTSIAVGGILSVLTQSVTPIGIVLFGDVFWTSWISLWGVANIGTLIPLDLMVIFSIGVMFLFIAAVIGMLTGSG